MARLYDIPPPSYLPPISQEEADAIRNSQIEEAEMRAAEKLLDPLGRELVDETPMAPPVGYNPQPSLAEQMRMMIQGERMRIAAELGGFETFEEADDFDLDEDPFPRSPHEDEFDSPLPARELRRRRDAAAAAPPPGQTQQSGAATSGAPVTEAAQPPKSAAAPAADATP